MSETIGVCGYMSSGSSAVTDLLMEFENTQVLDDFELEFVFCPDGLDDLKWHVSNPSKHFGVQAIRRFRRLMESRGSGFYRKVPSKTRKQLTDEFLGKIVQLNYMGVAGEEKGSVAAFFRLCIRVLVQKITKKLKIKKLPKLYFSLINRRLELSVCPQNFDVAAKGLIYSVLDTIGRDNKKPVLVLDHPFCTNNPLRNFVYYDNPKAIIVDRDPRDCYLFCMLFLKNRSAGLNVATDTVEDFIKWYKLMRVMPEGLRERDDFLFVNFEELLYDYDNAVQKISLFSNAGEHIRKGECFKPGWSRNNSRLFEKYNGYEQDITKIEKELPEYIFPFEKFPDIESEGEMFFGRQGRRN